MIQSQSKLHILDNSGVKFIQCIKSLKKKSSWGNLILASVKEIRIKNKVNVKFKKGSIVFAYIIKSKIFLKRKSGMQTNSSKNAAILLNKEFQPVGSRILSFMPNELRTSKILKHSVLAGISLN